MLLIPAATAKEARLLSSSQAFALPLKCAVAIDSLRHCVPGVWRSAVPTLSSTNCRTWNLLSVAQCMYFEWLDKIATVAARNSVVSYLSNVMLVTLELKLRLLCASTQNTVHNDKERKNSSNQQDVSTRTKESQSASVHG